MKNFIVLVLMGYLVAGCGLFRSTVDRSSSADSTVNTERSMAVDEVESLSADIPAGYIDYIITGSGMKIQLRDSLPVGKSRPSDKTDTTLSDSATANNGQPVPDEVNGYDNGMLSIMYDRQSDVRDSSRTKTESKETMSSRTETQVESNVSWIAWLLGGLAVGLALVVAGFLFFRR